MYKNKANHSQIGMISLLNCSVKADRRIRVKDGRTFLIQPTDVPQWVDVDDKHDYIPRSSELIP